jgi:3-deoxy-D-manno-octulosonic-acid transferase
MWFFFSGLESWPPRSFLGFFAKKQGKRHLHEEKLFTAFIADRFGLDVVLCLMLVMRGFGPVPGSLLNSKGAQNIGINVYAQLLVVLLGLCKVPALNTRFNINSRLEGPWPEGPFLWFHGASLGECRMLLNLSKCLQEDLPNCPQILITSQKTEVVEFLQNSGAPVSVALAPVDTPQAMNRFMKTVLPIALILAENELGQVFFLCAN